MIVESLNRIGTSKLTISNIISHFKINLIYGGECCKTKKASTSSDPYIKFNPVTNKSLMPQRILETFQNYHPSLHFPSILSLCIYILKLVKISRFCFSRFLPAEVRPGSKQSGISAAIPLIWMIYESKNKI